MLRRQLTCPVLLASLLEGAGKRRDVGKAAPGVFGERSHHHLLHVDQ